MHRIAKVFLASAVTLSLMGGLAAAEDSYYLELPSKGITTSTKITVDVPGENDVEDGINPITGEAWSGAYTPILVNIDAHPDALPHWGVSSADLIYEMPIQADGSTRSLAPALLLWMRTAAACRHRQQSSGLPEKPLPSCQTKGLS